MNDLIQSLAVCPVFKGEFALDFGQISLVTPAFQLTASLLQPFMGHSIDGRLLPYPLPLPPC